MRNLTPRGCRRHSHRSCARHPPVSRQRTLAIARDEADRQGLLTITHIESMEDARAAIAGGSGYLTRTPSDGELR